VDCFDKHYAFDPILIGEVGLFASLPVFVEGRHEGVEVVAGTGTGHDGFFSWLRGRHHGASTAKN